MSLLKEVSGNIVGSTRLGTFSTLNVDQQVFTEERGLVQDLPLTALVPNGHIINCVFAFPPGIPVLDSSAPTFVDDLLKYLHYSFPLRTPWGIYFIDTAINQESDNNYYQYQLRKTVFSNQAGNFYFLGTEPVADGYWAISGIDLFYSGASIPTLVGPQGPGQELFALSGVASPPLTPAPAPWFQFFPTKTGGPAIDSRRCYYLKFGIPSSTAGVNPATFGAPYAAQGIYGEVQFVKKVIDVYGSSGQSAPADVGFYSYDNGDGSRIFAYVAVSQEGNPLSGDFVPAPPRVYRLNTTAVTPSVEAAALNETYWGVDNSLGIGSQLFNAQVVVRETDALLTIQPVATSVSPKGFVESQTGIATQGAMFPSKYGIAFKPEGSSDWSIFSGVSPVAGFDPDGDSMGPNLLIPGFQTN